jgi:hypothetical protein
VSRDKEAAAARAQLETEIRRNEAALHTFTTGALIDALFAADAALIKAEGLLLEGNRLRMELSGGATLWGNPYDRPKRDIERNIATLDPSRFDYTTGGLMEKQRNNKR